MLEKVHLACPVVRQLISSTKTIMRNCESTPEKSVSKLTTTKKKKKRERGSESERAGQTHTFKYKIVETLEHASDAAFFSFIKLSLPLSGSPFFDLYSLAYLRWLAELVQSLAIILLNGNWCADNPELPFLPMKLCMHRAATGEYVCKWSVSFLFSAFVYVSECAVECERLVQLTCNRDKKWEQMIFQAGFVAKTSRFGNIANTRLWGGQNKAWPTATETNAFHFLFVCVCLTGRSLVLILIPQICCSRCKSIWFIYRLCPADANQMIENAENANDKTPKSII